MGVREGKESSHTPILPHTHTEKDDYFPGMALTALPENGGGVPQGRRGRCYAPYTVFSENGY